jgi:hypothetical protein
VGAYPASVAVPQAVILKTRGRKESGEIDHRSLFPVGLFLYTIIQRVSDEAAECNTLPLPGRRPAGTRRGLTPGRHQRPGDLLDGSAMAEVK